MDFLLRTALLVGLFSLAKTGGHADLPTTSPVPAPNSVAGSAPAAAASSPARAPASPGLFALQAKSQEGDPAAEVDLSYVYYLGKYIPQDYQKAYDWSLESAIQGNIPAERNIATFYEKGSAVHSNQPRAFAWFLKAARQGDPAAERAVGVRLQFGVGTARNARAAVDWYRKAAVQGETEAQARLGDCLLHGIGGETNLEQGFAYMMEASSNNLFARYIVGKCYADGLYVSRDPVRAYAWCLIALQTEKPIQDLLGTLKDTLTADQLKEAADLSVQILEDLNSHAFQTNALQVTLEKGAPITVQFNDSLGYIVVPLTLQNKEKVNFLIDTGCSTSAIDSRLASKFNLTGKDYLTVSGIGANIDLAVIADDVTISGLGLSISGARMTLLPHFDFDEYLGHPLGGIIGLDILKQLVMRVDYPKKTLTLALPGQLAADPKEVSLPLDINRNCAFAQVGAGDDPALASEGTFLVDTGDPGTLTVTKLFQEMHPNFHVPSVVQSSASGLGGKEKIGIGRTAISLGSLTLRETPINMDTSRQGAWLWLNGGVLGTSILDRYTYTLDFPASKLGLLPNAKTHRPFDFTFAGIGIKTTGGDYKTFVVYDVLPDSPASSAGLKVGDYVEQIDKKKTRTLRMEEVYDLVSKLGTHELQIRRDTASLTVPLVVYDPFLHPEQTALYDKSAQAVFSAPQIVAVTVQFIGPAIYPDDVIVHASGIAVGGKWFPVAGNRAIKELYATGLFVNVGIKDEETPAGVKVTLIVQPVPVVKSIAFTGLSAQEENDVRLRMITEEGKRSSAHDLFEDLAVIREVAGKSLLTAKVVTVDVTGDDGIKRHQEVFLPPTGPGLPSGPSAVLGFGLKPKISP
jgi:hypothetical protein